MEFIVSSYIVKRLQKSWESSHEKEKEKEERDNFSHVIGKD